MSTQTVRNYENLNLKATYLNNKEDSSNQVYVNYFNVNRGNCKLLQVYVNYFNVNRDSSNQCQQEGNTLS